MGQGESTLSQSNPKPSQASTVTEQPFFDSKQQLQNQANFFSLNNRTETYLPTTTNHDSAGINRKLFPQTKTPFNGKEHPAFFTEHKNDTSISKVSYSLRPGAHQVKRRNSEDFDIDLMEENSSMMKQNMNILEHLESIVSPVTSKVITESSFRPGESKINSENNSFNTNKSMVYSQSNQLLQKNKIPQNRPAQKGELSNKRILTLKKGNVHGYEDIIPNEESLNVRKQTFGKENQNSEIKEMSLIRSNDIGVENKAFQNDEVKIMETGYSSSRKLDSDRDHYDHSSLNSNRIREDGLKSSRRGTDNNNSLKASSNQNPIKSLPQQPGVENKEARKMVQEMNEYKSGLANEKKSLYSLLIEDSHNPSPIRVKKSSQVSQRNTKGFPDVEFSFKPNTLSKDKPRYSTEQTSGQPISARGDTENLKQKIKPLKSLRRSQSYNQKKSVPSIQILESESSSYNDGPVSTESASSLSSVKQPYITRNSKMKRNHSTSNLKSTRRQSRILEGSSHYTAYPYTAKYANAPHNMLQNYQTVPHHPMLTAIPSMPALHGLPMMPPPMDSYPYIVNQNPYYVNPNFPQVPTPLANNYPYYYQNVQVTPQPIGMYSSPQFYGPAQPMHHVYVQDFASPSSYANLPPMSSNGRQTPFQTDRYLETGRNCCQCSGLHDEGNITAKYITTQQRENSGERTGAKVLKSSRSVKSLKGCVHTQAHDCREQLMAEPQQQIAAMRVDFPPYQNQILGDVRPSVHPDSYSRDNRNSLGAGRVSIGRNIRVDTPQNIDNVAKNILDMDKVNRLADTATIENTSPLGGTVVLNGTVISRINEVSRTRKAAYQEESEGVQELNMTEYSLVQKLEGHGKEVSVKGLSMIGSPTGKENRGKDVGGQKNWNKIGQEKGANVLVFGNDRAKAINNEKPARKGKMEILLENNNQAMSWEIKNFMSNKTPDLPNSKNINTQVMTFEPLRHKSDLKPKPPQPHNRSMSTRRDQTEAQSAKKGMKLCFDFTENSDVERKGDRERSGLEETQERSIAEYFKQRKQSLYNKLEEENKKFASTPSSHQKVKDVDKEELYQKRREMMKSSAKKGQAFDTVSSGAPVRNSSRTPHDLSNIRFSEFPTSPIEGVKRTDLTVMSGCSFNVPSHNSRRNTRELNASVMERLALGQKPKMSKKEMIALTTKHYQNLPEVKKKVDEKKRKEEQMEELKKRKEKVRDLDARLRRAKSSKRTITHEGNGLYMS